MKSSFISCAAFVLALGTLPSLARAQDAEPQQPVSGKQLYFVIGGGLTNGGTKLSEVEFDDGSTENVKAGGFVHVYGGLEYRFTPEWSAEANIGYHVSDTSEATNGSLKFARVPLELVGRYAFNSNWRIGAGVRETTNVKFKGSGVLATNVGFKNATGVLLEGEYLATPHIGIKLRAVSEKYKTKDGGIKVSGNHVGLYLAGYF